MFKFKIIYLLFFIIVILSRGVVNAADEFIELGDLGAGGSLQWPVPPNPDFYSIAYAVSADGTVVVGYSVGASGTEAYRWTEAGGMVGLGFNAALDVSDDGSVLVGSRGSGAGLEAVRWTEAGGVVGLGGVQSRASAVSADSLVVVGYSEGGINAFRWTQAGGMVGLGDLPGGTVYSYARDVSGDGSVVVGYSDSASGGYEAFRWTQAGGMVGLGDLPGGTPLGAFISEARAISSDGSVIVGYGTSDLGFEAFRWTQAGGMVGLGIIGAESKANAVSSDGSIIVGGTSLGAFRWTEAGGMQSVSDWLAGNFISHGWQSLELANGVSDDGYTVVGYGLNANGGLEAFIARNTGIIGITDFSSSLNDLRLGNSLAAKSSRYMSGTASTFKTTEKNQSIITPFVAMLRGSDIKSGGLTLEHAWKNLSIKTGLAAVKAEDDARYRGEVEMEGVEASVALQIKPLAQPDGGLAITLGYTWGDYDSEFERSYLNGATTDVARGKPDIKSESAFVKLGWKFPLSSKVAITPYAELLRINTEVGGYTETGAAFGGSVSSQEYDGYEQKLGVMTSWQASEKLRVAADLTAVRLSDDTGPGVSVDLSSSGLGTFSQPGVNYKREWMELGISAKRELSASTHIGITGRVTNSSDYAEDWSVRLELAHYF